MAGHDLQGVLESLKAAPPGPYDPPLQGMATFLRAAARPGAPLASTLPLSGRLVQTPSPFVQDNAPAGNRVERPRFSVVSMVDAPVWRGTTGAGAFEMGEIGRNGCVLRFPVGGFGDSYGFTLVDPASNARTRFALRIDGGFLAGASADGGEYCVVTLGPGA